MGEKIPKEKLSELNLDENPEILHINQILDYNPNTLLKSLDVSSLKDITLTLEQLRSLEPDVLTKAVQLNKVVVKCKPDTPEKEVSEEESNLKELLSESSPKMDVAILKQESIHEADNQEVKTEKKKYTAEAVETFDIVEDTFRNLPAFKILHLENNNILNIHEKAFDNLAHLEELYLQNNLLEMLDFRIFSSLANIRSINLDGNHFKALDHDIFSGLYKLEEISIVYNKCFMSSEFITLDLEENVKKVSFKKPQLKRELFKDIEVLETNNIKLVKKKKYDKWSFLDIIENKVDITKIEPSQTKLYNHLKELSKDVKVLDLTNLDVKQLQSNALHALVNQNKIESINFEKNLIKDVHQAAFHCMPSLSKLDLKYNKIKCLEQEMFLGTENVQVLYFGFNQIEEIHPDAFKCCENLILIEISNNSLKKLSAGIFKNMPKLETLNLSAGLQEGCEIEEGVFHSLPSLENLYLNENKITILHPNLFSELESLAVLELAKNHISRLDPKIFENLDNLKLINLDDNKLEQLSHDLFKGLTSLQFISMNGNILQSREFLILNLEGSVVEFMYRQACGVKDVKQDMNENQFSLLNDLGRIRSPDSSSDLARLASRSMTEIEV